MSEGYAPIPTDALLGQMAWLRRLARDLTRDESSADDVVQETMVAALKTPPHRASALRAWLRAVARNVVRQRARSEGARAQRERRSARPEGLGPDSAPEVLARAELHRQAMDAVLQLEEPYRATLLLRYVEDRSPAEIAARQGVPAGTVRSRLKRGLDQVRERLDRENGGDRRAWLVPLLALWETDGPPPAPVGGGRAGWLKAAAVAVTGVALTVVVAVTFLVGEDPPPEAPRPGAGETAPLTGEVASADPVSNAPSAGLVTGRAVDAAGRPVAARVAVIPAPGEFRQWFNSRQGRGLAASAPAPSWEGEIADGAFELPCPSGARACLIAVGDGLALYPSDAHDLVPGGGTALLVLGPAGDVVGRVEDASGAPVSGAWVVLLSERWGGAPVANAWMRDRSGPDGAFRIRNAPAGQALLFVEHPEFAVASVPAQVPGEGGVVRLDRGRAIEGIVVGSAGRPAAGVAVEVFAGAIGPETATSGEDGRFRVDRVLPGPDITILADGGLRGMTAVKNHRAGPVVIRLDPVVRRTVRVTEVTDGDPIPVADLDLAYTALAECQFRPLPRVRTNAAGRVEILVRDGVRWTLAPDPRHPVYGVRPGFPIESDGEWELRLERKATVSGRVLGAEGRPVPGAEVGIAFGGSADPALLTGLVFTDAEGRFTVRGVRTREGEVAAFARHPMIGWAASRSFLAEAGAVIGDVEIVLRTGAVIAGRVVDESGVPLFGAEVRVSRHSAFPVGQSVPLDAYAPVVTAPDGRFRIGGLVERDYEMRIERDGYRDARIRPVPARPDGHDMGDVVLSLGHALAGRVVNRTGTPIFGAVVSASEHGGGSWGQARTDAAGSFRIAGLAAAPHLLRAGATGFETSAPRNVEVPSLSPIEVVLEATGAGLSISGEVRDWRDYPVPTALVIAAQESDPGRTVATAWADAKGRFLLEGLEAGEHRISVLGGHHVFDFLNGVRAGAEDVVVRARPHSAIAGAVYLPDGSPAAGIRVRAVAESRDGRGGEVRTTGDGVFRIEGLRGETFTVDAFGPDVAAAPIRGVAVDGRDIDVRLAEALTIEGSVTAPDGGPAAGAHVVAAPDGPPRLERTAVVRSDGSFTLRGLFPGQWKITVTHHRQGRGEAGPVPAGRKNLRVELKKEEKR